MCAKRLFLFAAYDADGVTDDALKSYVSACANLGDVVVVMDADGDARALDVSRRVLYTAAHRHGEYDFGSYRRAYEWAHDNLDLSEYDFLYLVNDSVYITGDIADAVAKMESGSAAMFGMVKNPHRNHPHIQSWFIGMTRDVFCTPWFDDFMRRITRQPSKGAITRIYEHGLSRIVMDHGLAIAAIMTVPGRGVYNRPKKLWRGGIPMFKKCAITRRGGAVAGQVEYILRHMDANLRAATIASARRTYGAKNVDRLLTRNPIKTVWRNIKYFIHKILTGEI